MKNKIGFILYGIIILLFSSNGLYLIYKAFKGTLCGNQVMMFLLVGYIVSRNLRSLSKVRKKCYNNRSLTFPEKIIFSFMLLGGASLITYVLYGLKTRLLL